MHAENPAKEAGRTLGISPRTVDFQRANLLKKLARQERRRSRP
jgi:DNA-binding CsgD family transcriptional regulator